jgi:hypothetical protein
MAATWWLCTREDVMRALDVKLSARNIAQVDRVIGTGARLVERRLARTFRPVTATRYFDWPNRDSPTSWRLWLDANEIISLTSLVAGGTTIASTDYFLEPANYGPPYNRIEIDLASSAAFAAGSTHQRAIVATGLFGHSNNEASAGLVDEALDDSETDVTVTDSSLVGVGDILRVDSERLRVTERAMVDTGQNTTALTALASSNTITSITAGTIKVGEVLLIDSERMLVVDVSGTTVTVKRAWDGTVLAAHSNGADIYAPRVLTVERGALGTTATAHSDQAVLWRHLVPGPARDLNIAEAINLLQQEGTGYARRSGLGEARGTGKPNSDMEASGRGLDDLRYEAEVALGRQARIRAI